MSEWPAIALDDVLDEVDRPVDVSSIEEVPYAGVRWYAGGVYARAIEDAKKVKTKVLNRLQTGDVTYNRMWATKAAFGIVGDDTNDCLVTGDFPIFEVRRSRLVTEYLALQFGSGDFQRTASLLAVGTTERKRLNERDFLRIEIPLPPLDEQRRIVAVVATVDAQIQALLAELNSTTDFLVRSRLALLIVGPRNRWQTAITSPDAPDEWTRSLPSDWRAERVGSVATIRSGATPRRSEQGRYFDGGTIPWVKTGDLNESHLGATDECITDVAMAESSTRLLPAGTVLVAMYGGYGQIGRTALLAVEAATNQAISALTELRSDVLPTFMHEVLKAGRLKWRRVAASSRKDPNITKTNVEDFDFPLPPISQQQEIVEITAVQTAKIDAVRAELAALHVVRSDLLTALLSQEITVDEAVDQFVGQVA